MPPPATEITPPAVQDAGPVPAAYTASGCRGQENAVVQVGRLNVRQGPAQNTAVLEVIRQGEQYRVTGYAGDGRWVQLQLLSRDRMGWVYTPMVHVVCASGTGTQVALQNLAHRWSQGAIVTGVGYVQQPVELYVQPSLEAETAGTASPERLLVVQEVVQNTAGERWARVWAPEAVPAERWIRADRVIPLPDTLVGLQETATLFLGTRSRIELYAQTLRRAKVVPSSDGGRPYRRRDYAVATATHAECPAACVFLQAQQHDHAWYLPYEDRYTRDATDLVVVPLVPEYEVHVSEGWLWNDQQRRQYALEHAGDGTWVVMSRKMHHERGVQDPGGWLPGSHGARCQYAADWIAVKAQWDLAMDADEHQSLADVLSLCDDRHLAASRDTREAAALTPATEVSVRVRLQCDARRELVTITNLQPGMENLTGWHLHDENNENRFTLPRWQLPAGTSVTVASGNAVGDIHLTDALIWNNNGDTVYLYDASYTLVAVQPCT